MVVHPHFYYSKTYQKVEDTQSEDIEWNAHMTMIVEPVEHWNTETVKKNDLENMSKE